MIARLKLPRSDGEANLILDLDVDGDAAVDIDVGQQDFCALLYGRCIIAPPLDSGGLGE